MPAKTVVSAPNGLKTPLLSQAIVHNRTVYASGNVGIDYSTMKLVEGSIADETRQALDNMRVVLEEAGSSLANILKCNIYIIDMANYAAMNAAYMEIVPDPKPARTCVCVKELPFKAGVEIECIAHL